MSLLRGMDPLVMRSRRERSIQKGKVGGHLPTAGMPTPQEVGSVGPHRAVASSSYRLTFTDSPVCLSTTTRSPSGSSS